jgi:membrane fusion protein (multidrug efflux system)
VFVVPQTAVMQTEKGYLVFVVDADNKAALRPVQMGEWTGSNWTVMSGLNAGERVIVDNLLKVRPGAPVTPTAVTAAPAAAGADGKSAPAAGSEGAKPAAPSK